MQDIQEPVATDYPTNQAYLADLTEAVTRLIADPAAEYRGTYLRQAKLRRSRLAGSFFPMAHLQMVLGLSPREIALLEVCLAAHLDRSIFAGISAKAAPDCLDLDRVCQLLFHEPTERAQVGAFLGTAPLVLWKLIELNERGTAANCVRLDPRIARYLLGNLELDPKLSPWLGNISPASFQELLIGPEPHEQLVNLAENLAAPAWHQPYPPLRFTGRAKHSKRLAAAALATRLDLGLLQLDLAAMHGETFPDRMVMTMREGLLLRSGFFLENVHALAEPATHRTRLLAELARYALLTVADDPSDCLQDEGFLEIFFANPGPRQRLGLWQPLFNDAAALSPIINRYQFNEDQVLRAQKTARYRALLRADDPFTIRPEDIRAGCRAQCRHKLDELAVKVESKARWQHLILPEEQLRQLQEIPDHVTHQERVFKEWGLGTKLFHGLGTHVLFSGGSGTGKTLAASVLANELGLELYRIDLSALVSKYIGETEKNLSRVFQEGTASQAILFFDEADALFGKRSEVRDSHDRYANLETSFLLQKMEEYQGLSILATNLDGNMDQAFLRRIRFIIPFPFPDRTARRHILEFLIPESAPLAKDVDLDFLADKLALAGGGLKNVVLNAFFLGASRGEVGMTHFLHAAKREWQKDGRPFLADDFAPYHQLLTTLKPNDFGSEPGPDQRSHMGQSRRQP